ncbi:hypothetical protein Zmor_014923 [Zophobas morio]|uniref:Uncharacterized protein n=1 Tax=Zophobas morio TaxID=2755281 RepID=A0AA38IL67_9CUCU|nr:hypothetical protein Zmor_014923 [Zophobas morio]
MSASSLSSLSEENDEEGRLQAARIHCPRRFFVRKDPFELYDDMDFKERYINNKNTFNELLNLIGHHLEPTTKRNHSISATPCYLTISGKCSISTSARGQYWHS